MLPGFLAELGAWNWLIGGLILLGLEIIAPGAFLMWLGIAALIVGGLSLLIGVPWQAQAIVFAVLAVVLVLLSRRFMAGRAKPHDHPHLNERAARLVGKTFPLVDPIRQGHGRIRVDDSTWAVSGPDLPAGTLVRVTGHDGVRLRVELS